MNLTSPFRFYIINWTDASVSGTNDEAAALAAAASDEMQVIDAALGAVIEQDGSRTKVSGSGE